MTLDSNLSNTELVAMLEGIDAQIGTLKEDDSLIAVLERQELFQKQDMVMSILDDRYEDDKNRVISGLTASVAGIRIPHH